jgi:GT2 family glycosyltransferase
MNVTTEQHCNADGFSVSLVVYRPDVYLLARTLASLATAVDELRCERPALVFKVCIVDNGGLGNVSPGMELLKRQGVSCSIVSGHGNVGYGRGHNLAIARAVSAYHLVLNPDIDLDPAALVEALAFFEQHPEVGLLTPRIGDESGALQYLCRRYPTVFDLFARGFMPHGVRQHFRRRLACYEMRDMINERDVVWDPPIVSGCFMLFRTDLLKRLAGFDPRYFLYFEDYDLTLRAHEISRVAYVPSVRVVHHGGGASRKGLTHIRMFAGSAFKFFNRFGWKWL